MIKFLMSKTSLLSLLIAANTFSLFSTTPTYQKPTLQIIQEQYLRQEKLQISSLENTLNQFNAFILDAQTPEERKYREKKLLESNLQNTLLNLNTDTQLQNTILDFYALNDTQLKKQPQTIIPLSTLADDLYITCGPVEETKNSLSYKSEQRLINFLLQSQEGLPFYATKLGKMKLLKTLGEPTTDIQFLNKKRAVHTFLQKNQSVTEQLKNVMKRIKNLEFDVLTFWNKPYTHEIISKSPCFPPEFNAFLPKSYIDSLNKSPQTSKALNIGMMGASSAGIYMGCGLVSNYWIQTASNFANLQEAASSLLAQCTLANATTLVIPASIAALTNGLFSYLGQHSDGKKKFLYNNKEVFSILSAAIAYCILHQIPLATLTAVQWSSLLPTLSSLPIVMLPFALAKMFMVLVPGMFHIYNTFINRPKKLFINANDAIDKQNIALHSLSILIHEMKNLKQIITNHPELYNNLELHAHLDAKKSISQQVSTDEDKDDFTSLSTILDGYNQNETEYKNRSFLSKLWNRIAHSSIPTGYHMMLSLKKHFGLPLEAIGEVDMYLTLNNLLNHYKDKDIKVCIAKFKETKTPYLRAKNTWNPLLLANNKNTKSIVTNTIKLGGMIEPRVAIVSGSTEGGKSTFLRTITSATYTAQTLAVAFAEEFTINPPERICAPFKKQDNIGKNASGFKSEIENVEQIINSINETNGNCLICIDEIFQLVPNESGEESSYHTIKDSIIPRKNVLSIIVTHRKSPKKLAKENPKNCKNYYFKNKEYLLNRGESPVEANEEKEDNLKKLLSAKLITQKSYDEAIKTTKKVATAA